MSKTLRAWSKATLWSVVWCWRCLVLAHVQSCPVLYYIARHFSFLRLLRSARVSAAIKISVKSHLCNMIALHIWVSKHTLVKCNFLILVFTRMTLKKQEAAQALLWTIFWSWENVNQKSQSQKYFTPLQFGVCIVLLSCDPTSGQYFFC